MDLRRPGSPAPDQSKTQHPRLSRTESHVDCGAPTITLSIQHKAVLSRRTSTEIGNRESSGKPGVLESWTEFASLSGGVLQQDSGLAETSTVGLYTNPTLNHPSPWRVVLRLWRAFQIFRTMKSAAGAIQTCRWSLSRLRPSFLPVRRNAPPHVVPYHHLPGFLAFS